MQNIEENLKPVLKKIKEKCIIPVQGMEMECPYCGGYAIATTGYDGGARLLCMNCKRDIQWEATNTVRK